LPAVWLKSCQDIFAWGVGISLVSNGESAVVKEFGSGDIMALGTTCKRVAGIRTIAITRIRFFRLFFAAGFSAAIRCLFYLRYCRLALHQYGLRGKEQHENG
jgi:hypothetical protein